MKATQIVHWPGKDTFACDKHTAQLKSLGDYMGFAVSSTPCLTDAACANCENEEKKELERLARL
jgi:hypothetical protein